MPDVPRRARGPGGAYAFDDASGSVVPPPGPVTGILVARGAGGRGSAGPRLRLNREPAALSALAAQRRRLGSARGERARAISNGRESRAPRAAAAAHRRRTAAVRCGPRGLQEHLSGVPPAGRPRTGPRGAEPGRDRRWRLRRRRSPSRILLNGKEGPIGLMPPIGMTLSDDQIAGVLTYIRREWGQPGTPVDSVDRESGPGADRGPQRGRGRTTN